MPSLTFCTDKGIASKVPKFFITCNSEQRTDVDRILYITEIWHAEQKLKSGWWCSIIATKDEFHTACPVNDRGASEKM